MFKIHQFGRIFRFFNSPERTRNKSNLSLEILETRLTPTTAITPFSGQEQEFTSLIATTTEVPENARINTAEHQDILIFLCAIGDYNVRFKDGSINNSSDAVNYLNEKSAELYGANCGINILGAYQLDANSFHVITSNLCGGCFERLPLIVSISNVHREVFIEIPRIIETPTIGRYDEAMPNPDEWLIRDLPTESSREIETPTIDGGHASTTFDLESTASNSDPKTQDLEVFNSFTFGFTEEIAPEFNMTNEGHSYESAISDLPIQDFIFSSPDYNDEIVSDSCPGIEESIIGDGNVSTIFDPENIAYKEDYESHDLEVFDAFELMFDNEIAPPNAS